MVSERPACGRKKSAPRDPQIPGRAVFTELAAQPTGRARRLRRNSRAAAQASSSAISTRPTVLSALMRTVWIARATRAALAAKPGLLLDRAVRIAALVSPV